MTYTNEANHRSAMVAAWIADIDNGAVGSGGYGCWETSGDVIVASVQFDDPCATETPAGTATISSAPLSDTNAAGGTVEHFSIYDNTGAFESKTGKVLEISCQTGAADNVIQMSTLSVPASATVTLTSLTWTYPSSVATA